jgi:hypothetical protein
MKKLLTIVCAVLFIGAIFAVPAMATCNGPNCGPTTVTGDYQGQAASKDFSFSKSSWFGNDFGFAKAEGFAGGTVETYANSGSIEYEFVGWEYVGGEAGGPGYYEKQHGKCAGKIKYFRRGHPQPNGNNEWVFLGAKKKPVFEEIVNPGFAFEIGSVYAWNTSNTWSFAKDFGMTSLAGAGASTEGGAISSGMAIGPDGCDELVDASASVGGYVSQHNEAGETGYPGGDFVEGGSFSEAGYTATNFGSDAGSGFAVGMAAIHGEATTKGCTFVTIDPYGNHQSLFGSTNAMSNISVCGADIYDGTVSGNGYIAGQVSSRNGLTYGGGVSTFNYLGNISGSGNANLSVVINTGGNSSSVHVSGSSYAGAQ